jgi:hypothetical protein
MGISQAFLTELEEQRRSSAHDLSEAQRSCDEAAEAAAQARLCDLEELLQRSGSIDIRLDGVVDLTGSLGWAV